MEIGEVLDHARKLEASGLGIAEYCRQAGVQRRRLAEGIEEHDVDAYTRLRASGVIADQVDAPRKGAKLETSAKQMLERKKGGGWCVVKQYASKGAFDLLAVGPNRRPLMIQAKKSGVMTREEWNQLYDAAVLFGCLPILVRRPEGESTGAVWFRLLGRKDAPRMRSDPLLAPFDPAHSEQPSLASQVVDDVVAVERSLQLAVV